MKRKLIEEPTAELSFKVEPHLFIMSELVLLSRSSSLLLVSISRSFYSSFVEYRIQAVELEKL